MKICVFQVDAGGEVVWTKKERNLLRLVHAKMRRFEITRNKPYEADDRPPFPATAAEAMTKLARCRMPTHLEDQSDVHFPWPPTDEPDLHLARCRFLRRNPKGRRLPPILKNPRFNGILDLTECRYIRNSAYNGFSQITAFRGQRRPGNTVFSGAVVCKATARIVVGSAEA